MDRIHVVWLEDSGEDTVYTVWLGPVSLREREGKGIIYSSKTLTPTYLSVDSPARDKAQSSARMYARIQQHWYVFWDWQ